MTIRSAALTTTTRRTSRWAVACNTCRSAFPTKLFQKARPFLSISSFCYEKVLGFFELYQKTNLKNAGHVSFKTVVPNRGATSIDNSISLELINQVETLPRMPRSKTSLKNAALRSVLIGALVLLCFFIFSILLFNVKLACRQSVDLGQQ